MQELNMVEVDEVGGGNWVKAITQSALGSMVWEGVKAVGESIVNDFKNHKSPAADDHTWHK